MTPALRPTSAIKNRRLGLHRNGNFGKFETNLQRLMRVVFLIFIFVLSFSNVATAQAKTVFKCKFEGLAFYITINETDLSARLGLSIGIGNYGQAYFDSLHKFWIVVGSVNGGLLPTNLTTILPNGDAFYSVHSIWSAEKVWTSQNEGKCLKL